MASRETGAGGNPSRHRISVIASVLVEYAHRRRQLDKYHKTEVENITTATIEEAMNDVRRLPGPRTLLRCLLAIYRASLAVEMPALWRVRFAFIWVRVSLRLFFRSSLAYGLIFWSWFLVFFGRLAKCSTATFRDLGGVHDEIVLRASNELQMSSRDARGFVWRVRVAVLFCELVGLFREWDSEEGV